MRAKLLIIILLIIGTTVSAQTLEPFSDMNYRDDV